MKYIVSVAVDGRMDVEVEANGFDEAAKKAVFEAGDADINTMEFIALKPVNAEDENGKFVDF